MGKQYASVVEMIRDILGDEDPGFVKELEDRIEKRKLIKEMQVQRALAEISEELMAELMRCPVERIKEIENGYDDQVTAEEVRQYLLVCRRNKPILDSFTASVLFGTIIRYAEAREFSALVEFCEPERNNQADAAFEELKIFFAEILGYHCSVSINNNTWRLQKVIKSV